MQKEQRDSIIGRLGPEERTTYRALIQEVRNQRKASSSAQFTVREVLEPRKAGLSESVQSALDAVIARDEMGPSVGQVPPDFFLKRMGSEDRVQLSSFAGKRPVGLIFGSYT